MKRKINTLMAVILMCMMLVPMIHMEANAADVLPFTGPLDYSLSENWVFDGAYPENGVDVFIVSPTVEKICESNAEITAEYKKRLLYAMNQQQAIYARTARIFAPYYRQASLKAYSLGGTDKEQTMNNAYMDVSAAFQYYIENKNDGRPLIIAGFSQGADMCYRLLEEYYGGESERAVALRNNLIAVYAIGWCMTDEMINKYPQIVPAKGETDTGVVVSYECENGQVTNSVVIPAGAKVISINPLNWSTDTQVADKDLNKGSVKMNGKTGEITSLEVGRYGAYIDPDRGSLVVTDIDTSAFPPRLSLLPEGSFHLYDSQLFYVNVVEHIQKRTASFLNQNTVEVPEQ